MLFVLAILLAGLWAAYMLPSFFDDRGRAPRSSTKAFAHRKQVLRELTNAQPDSKEYVRQHAQIKRQRILLGLGASALFTLVVATLTGSVSWLMLTIAFDIALASYVSLLLYTTQQARIPRATVVPIGAMKPAEPAVPLVDEPANEQSLTVRVIAG